MEHCDICNQDIKIDEATHLPLYIRGSEGILICLNCKMALTEHIRRIMSIVSTAKKASFKAGRKNAQPEDTADWLCMSCGFKHLKVTPGFKCICGNVYNG